MSARRAIASALALVAGLAGGQARADSPYRIERLRPVLLPAGGDKGIGVERELEAYDVLMSAALAFPRVARPAAPIDVTLAGEHVSAAEGSTIPGAIASGGAFGAAARPVFCLPPHRPARGAHLAREVRACFVDGDGDRRLDAAFLEGAERAQDRALVPLDDIPYAEESDVPIPGARVELVFQVIQPALALVLAAESRSFIVTRARFGPAGAWVDARPSVEGGTYPRTVTLGSARIDIIAFDRANRRLRARIAAPFERADFDFQLPANISFMPFGIGS